MENGPCQSGEPADRHALLEAIELAGFRPLTGDGAPQVATVVAGIAADLRGPNGARARLEILSRLVASARVEVALLEALHRSVATSKDHVGAMRVARNLDAATRRLVRLLDAHGDEERRQPGHPRVLVTVSPAPPSLGP